jgi:hypothetical protein
MTAKSADRIRYFLIWAHPNKAVCPDCLAEKLELPVKEALAAVSDTSIFFLQPWGGCSFCAQRKLTATYKKESFRHHGVA